MNSKLLHILTAAFTAAFGICGILSADSKTIERGYRPMQEILLEPEEIRFDEIRETSDIHYLNTLYPISQTAYSIGNGCIEFPDHSVWEVNSDELYKLDSWEAGNHLLIITQNFSWFWTPRFKFMIHNESSSSSVEANMVLPPFPSHLQKISVVDQTNRCIKLADGSCWNISNRDDNIYIDQKGAKRRWMAGDQVIVGVNYETFGSISKPFILINTAIDSQFVHAQKLY
jgi:hypothetical protein